MFHMPLVWRFLIDFEAIIAEVSVMFDMKQTFQPTAVVNTFISDINKMGIAPLNVIIHIWLKIVVLVFSIFQLTKLRKS